MPLVGINFESWALIIVNCSFVPIYGNLWVGLGFPGVCFCFAWLVCVRAGVPSFFVRSLVVAEKMEM